MHGGDLDERKKAEREIHESHTLLTSIIEGTDDAIFMKDEHGRYLMVNSRAATLLGKPADEVIGKTDADLLPPDIASHLAEADRRVMGAGDALTVEETLPVAGVPRSFITTKSACRDHEGGVAGIIGVATDITGLKETEKALRESEALYRAVVEQAAENIFLVDMETKRIFQANAAFYDSLGYTAGEIENLTLYDIVAHDRASIDRNMERILEAGRLHLGERVYLRKDGTFLEVEVGAAALSYGDVDALCVVAHDITERKDAEYALSEVREAERRRIARDLHDLSLQHIASALQMMQATQIEENVGDDSDLGRQISALREAVRGLRGAIYDLRLEGGRPFVRSIESLVEMFHQLYPERDAKLKISEDFPPDLPEPTKTQLTRVVQEALTNVRRHSEARSVTVGLGLSEGWIEISVTDDGSGFDPSERVSEPSPESGYGVGLSGMEERMRAIGGELSVESEPGAGTKVVFRVPR
ncbi:N/A [soil metagenome]